MRAYLPYFLIYEYFIFSNEKEGLDMGLSQ